VKPYPRRRVREFVASLAARPQRRDSFNPYRDAQMARNLESYLRTLWRYPHYDGLLLVGEALGYKGGRNTGIPFSSGRLYSEAGHPFLRLLAPKLGLSWEDSEVTANIVWRELLGRQSVPLFWNAFPFHPHQRGKPASNRKPRASEVAEGTGFLRELVDIYKPRRIAGIGREGQRIAAKLFPQHAVHYVRHPSYGGKAEFSRGLERLLDELAG
jgi:uracil-DNA glycosylase